MHTAYIRPGGIAQDIPVGLLYDIHKFINTFAKRLDDIEEILNKNRIFVGRVKNIGTVSYGVAREHALTGVMARGSGIPYDLRKLYNYEMYDHFKFKIPVGTIGDCLDRYLIRMSEMRESLSIISQACNNIKPGPTLMNFSKITNPSRGNSKFFMESLIHHFKFFSSGFNMPNGLIYTAVEAPKGEFGTLIASHRNDKKPYRCYIRAPGFYHLAAINRIAKEHSLADIVAIIGTLDIVFGEVDR